MNRFFAVLPHSDTRPTLRAMVTATIGLGEVTLACGNRGLQNEEQGESDMIEGPAGDIDLIPLAIACDDDINALLDRIAGLEFEGLISEVRAASDGLRVDRLIGAIVQDQIAPKAA